MVFKLLFFLVFKNQKIWKGRFFGFYVFFDINRFRINFVLKALNQTVIIGLFLYYNFCFQFT